MSERGFFSASNDIKTLDGNIFFRVPVAHDAPKVLGTNNVASLLWLHWSPVLLYVYFFNLAKLLCKQTVVIDFCTGFVKEIHIIAIGKRMSRSTLHEKSVL